MSFLLERDTVHGAAGSAFITMDGKVQELFGAKKIDAKGNIASTLLLDYSYKTDIDEHTANCVKLARPNESTGRADVFQVMDSANIARWGLLQLYQTIDEALNDAQAAAQAQAMLAYYNRRWRTLKVSALGLPGLKAGQMLMMDVPALGDISLFGLVLLEKVTHTLLCPLPLRQGKWGR